MLARCRAAWNDLHYEKCTNKTLVLTKDELTMMTWLDGHVGIHFESPDLGQWEWCFKL